LAPSLQHMTSTHIVMLKAAKRTEASLSDVDQGLRDALLFLSGRPSPKMR
jgi:hypothetical protein